MQHISPPKLIAAIAGLTGFAVAIFAGLAANNGADVILVRAMLSMLVCYVVGAIVGGVMNAAVSEGIEQYMDERPVPDYEPVRERSEPGDVLEANESAETRAA